MPADAGPIRAQQDGLRQGPCYGPQADRTNGGPAGVPASLPHPSRFPPNPVKEITLLNNNTRGNNNRRRGRGNNNNNRPQGGGQYVNRIDSRARGNAPQMLEKYRKLAHDAHLNGDRVTAEYYLQFADHYFRVIADSRTRIEEARRPRDDRWQDPAEPYREEGEEAGELGDASDFPSFDQPPAYARAPREERPRREERAEAGAGADGAGAALAEPAGQADETVAASANPFVRDNRGARGLRPRREERRPPTDAATGAEAAGLDPTSLPPFISAARRGGGAEWDAGEGAGEGEEAYAAQAMAAPIATKPAPRRRAAPARPKA